MVLRATANSKGANDAKGQSASNSSKATAHTPTPVAPSIVSPYSPSEPTALEVQKCLKDLHILFRSERLYQRNHPRVLESLESAYEQLRGFAFAMNGLAFRIERNSPKHFI